MPGKYWWIYTGLDSEKEVWNFENQSAPLDQDIDPGASVVYA